MEQMNFFEMSSTAELTILRLETREGKSSGN